eukprot:jgi/Ulvmu1/5621/UM023_0160.1
MGVAGLGYDGVTYDRSSERGLLGRWEGLPKDVLARVVLNLPVEDILCLSCTCKIMRDVAMSDADVWLPLTTRLMANHTRPALWISRSGSTDGALLAHWPSSTYRQLYFTLKPFLTLDGLWLGTSLHQRSPGAPPDHILAFKWTSSALVCLRLRDDLQGHHEERQLWSVYFVLCKSSTAAPQLESIGHGLFIMHPTAGHVRERPTHAAQQHCATAIGVRASPVLGSSPPGSFESELLTFMSGQQERPRQGRRASRRKSTGMPSVWPERMHLRRAAPISASGVRGVLGLWSLVHYSSLHSPAVSTIDVSFVGGPATKRVQASAVGAVAAAEPVWSVQLEWTKDSGESYEGRMHDLHIDALDQLDALPQDFSCEYLSSATGQLCGTWQDLMTSMDMEVCHSESGCQHGCNGEVMVSDEDSLASLMHGMDGLHLEAPTRWELQKIFTGTESTNGVSVAVMELMTPSQQCRRLLLSHPDGLQLFARLQVQ